MTSIPYRIIVKYSPPMVIICLSFRLIGKFRDTEYDEYPSRYPNFEFLGQQPPSIVHQYMVASDILIMPSRYENFGLVALEAMTAGCALVVTKVGKLHLCTEFFIDLFIDNKWKCLRACRVSTYSHLVKWCFVLITEKLWFYTFIYFSLFRWSSGDCKGWSKWV